LDKLPYAGGASFDPKKVCLQNTRTAILETIWSWIKSTDVRTAEIFLLTSVAGAGKTTISHTVAQRCKNEKMLWSTFFFDRNVSGRNDPRMLFSTIARNLADQDSTFGQRVADAVDGEKSLVGASTSVHFADLILESSRLLLRDRPVVIIIDALDECHDPNEHVLEILKDEVPKLPGTFRILLTSRMMRGLEFYLLQEPHVRPLSINLGEHTNLQDTAIYARRRLKEVAKWGKLTDDWPGSLLQDEFISKAGGLFIWVFVVSEYLHKSINPEAKLKSLLSKHRSLTQNPEKKMDDMYSTIILGCDQWDDEYFVKGYDLVMGAIMAAKTPLSMSALQSLHRHDDLVRIHDYLNPLASLFGSLENDKTPVKILHHSLKDFLTIRAQSSSLADQTLFLNEKEHSERLGLLCLKVMNEDLEKCGPAVGYLRNASELEGVPDVGENVVSEELLYACNFWIAHVVKIEILGASLVDELGKFLSKYVVPWMEVSTSKGKFHDLSEVRKWLEVSISSGIGFTVF
jgi:AAA ATPase domain